MKYKYTRKDLQANLDAFYFRYQGEYLGKEAQRALGKFRDALLTTNNKKIMKPRITARIEKEKKGNGLWILLNRPEGERSLAFAIQEDEVEAILRACMEYLSKKDFLLENEKGEL